MNHSLVESWSMDRDESQRGVAADRLTVPFDIMLEVEDDGMMA